MKQLWSITTLEFDYTLLIDYVSFPFPSSLKKIYTYPLVHQSKHVFRWKLFGRRGLEHFVRVCTQSSFTNHITNQYSQVLSSWLDKPFIPFCGFPGFNFVSVQITPNNKRMKLTNVQPSRYYARTVTILPLVHF